MYRIMPKSTRVLTTTIVGQWIIDEKDKKDVNSEMRLFQCAVCTAFNRLLEDMPKGDVEKLVARRGLGFHERIPKKIQRLILVLIRKLTSLLPAMEAKGKREVKTLLSKLRNL